MERVATEKELEVAEDHSHLQPAHVVVTKDTQQETRCPATNATCHRCNRKGYFGAVCFSKRHAADATNNEVTVDLDAAYLGTISMDSITDQKTFWHCTVQVNENAVSFKLDTGAEVTAITKEHTRSFPRHLYKEPPKSYTDQHDKTSMSLASSPQCFVTTKHLQPTRFLLSEG